jgi:hypothetical protein
MIRLCKISNVAATYRAKAERLEFDSREEEN